MTIILHNYSTRNATTEKNLRSKKLLTFSFFNLYSCALKGQCHEKSVKGPKVLNSLKNRDRKSSYSVPLTRLNCIKLVNNCVE